MAPTDELPGQLPRTALFTCGVPYQFTIAGRGDTVLFLRGRTGDDRAACLWALDVATGAERLLAQAANLLGGGDQPLGAGSSATGISSYAASADGALAAFAVSGRLWVAHVGDGRVEQLPAASPVSDPRPDPTGRHIAYVCDGALRVIGVGGGSDRLIAAPDGPEVTFGVADFAGESALDGADGFWWSPDGERLLVKRVDTSRVELWHVADPADPARAPRGRRYPAAGTANAEVSLWIADLDGALTRVDSDRDAFEYVLRGGWSAQGPYVAVKSRDQRTARLLRVDPRTGATSTLGELTDTRWVQPIPGLPAVTDSGSVLWHVDDGETRRLTVDAVPVTPPGLQLRAVLGIEGDAVFFAATREPTERHLHTYRPGEGVRRLTTEPGVHAGERRAGTFVHVARGPEFFGSRTVVRRSGAPAVPVASFGATPALDLHVTRLVLGPRRLRAALYLPSWYQPRDGVDGRGGGRLPVLMDPYGGAGVQRVTADQGPHHLISQWFAEHGFAVLVVDSSGTPGRGPAWERESYGDLYTKAVEDQVNGLYEAARSYPALDLARVGVRGWSFGGSLAIAMLLRRPDVFHAAVAGAGPTDQRLYNAPWRERALGHPDAHPDWYAACSLLDEAPKLARPLLLMHGLMDDNVFPVHTLRMSSALLAAGRPHQVMLLPGVGHGVLLSDSAEPVLRDQLAFLRRHLGGASGGTDGGATDTASTRAAAGAGSVRA